jgi:hypothetical protein
LASDGLLVTPAVCPQSEGMGRNGVAIIKGQTIVLRMVGSKPEVIAMDDDITACPTGR